MDMNCIFPEKSDFKTWPEKNRWKTIILSVWATTLLMFILLTVGCNTKDPLTKEERAWLNQHDGKIIVNNESGWPPIIDTDEQGNPFGIVMDYQRLIEKKLKFKFQLDRPDSWENFMKRFRKGEIHVNNNLQKNSERSEYALFTSPYIEIPNVIIVRKENVQSLTLDKMSGMKIAVTHNFAIHHHIKKNYNFLQLIPLQNDQSCLLEVSTKDVDAAVVNLAVASHIIEKQGITNLHVAGYADYTNELCFASIKKWPILNQILEKGIDCITQGEKDAIDGKWISLGYIPFYKNSHFMMISLSIAAIIIAVFLIVIAWNKSLKRQIEVRTKDFKKANSQLKKEIEERHRVQEELEDSKNYLSATLNGLSASISLLDQDGMILLVNDSWRRFAEDNGLSSKEVSDGKNYLQVCDSARGENSEEAAKFANGIRSVLSAKLNHYHLEYPCHSSKQERWFVGRVTLFPGDGPRRVVIAHENITERKQAERSLLISEKKYRSMLESMDDPIYICSSNFTIEYQNPAMTNLLGKDTTGDTCHQAIFNKDGKCAHCVYPKITKGKKETISTPIDIGNKTFHVSNSPIINSDGTISKLSVYRDITETSNMEKRLQQSQKMEAIGTLAGGIAHDFNNILFPILGHTEMLLEDNPEDSPLRKSLNEIYTGALRARDLVQQILTFSRQGKEELKLMKMQPIIKETLKLIRSTIPTTIAINQNLQPDCSPVRADPTQMHQIVMNLATNAFHAMEKTGGDLKIALKENELGEYDLIGPDMTPGNYACLTVADTGMGMDKKLIEKIFNPFFTTKEGGKGTGMGLSVVHGIVKNMNGAIKVYSEPGKGTEVRVYLPAEKSTPKIQSEQPKEPLPCGTENILLVDDEEVIITMEKLALERLGYRVTSRTSSLEALEAFKASPDKFDLVITDMTMPQISGDKFAMEILKIRRDIPILLCTGFSETMTEEKINDIGIKGLLLKPIIMMDLAKKIRTVLDESENKI